MDFQVAGHQTEGYLINTEVYAGPLDLLLELIERAEMDITKVALAQVTDQYLAYLQNLKDRNPAEVSAFLVIAAKLVQIKSEALLPRPPEHEAREEDLGEALAQQLILYKKFKGIAAWLGEREAANLRTYLRLAPPPKVEGRVDLSDLTLQDLIEAAQSALLSNKNLPLLNTVVNMPRITIREKIRTILDHLKQRGTVSFQALLSLRHSRTDVVVTFLALLELVKQHIVEARQEGLFADIELQALGQPGETEEIEVEFKE